jgi:hypothetical protein
LLASEILHEATSATGMEASSTPITLLVNDATASSTPITLLINDATDNDDDHSIRSSSNPG